ncbi:VWA domain-containing protein [Lacipirellula limnantheis]|uniref:Chromosome segregation protein n=1 Tax=Lacipirellula limnantheis TaxID=2528024 RepID=A0A517TT99_9BACT|nr:VWA domain-containing protein [Lacipirellula limnantheis]QDT71599.1 chromosome segregation protein [Lacipirellula limnantheis]
MSRTLVCKVSRGIVTCWTLALLSWCSFSVAAGNAAQVGALAGDVDAAEGPVPVGYEAPDGALAADGMPAADVVESLPTPASTSASTDAKSLPVATSNSVVTDVIMLIDATQSMAWPSGRERRMAIAQWSALDIADGVPENIPAAFVALHDEATALRQLLPLTNDGRGHLRRTVMRLVPAGEGKVDKLLVEARRLLTSKPDASPLIVLVTDGVDCDPFSHGAPIRDLAQTYGDRLYFQVIGVGDNHVISAKLRDLANQAGSHGEFSSVKSHAELPTALSRCRQLFEQIGAQRAARAKQQAVDLAHCRAERVTLADRVGKLTKETAQLSGDLTVAQAKIVELNHTVEDLTKGRNVLSDRVVSLTTDLEAAQRDNANLTTDNKRLEVEKAQLIDESAHRLGEINRLTEDKHAVELSRDGYRRAYWTWLVLALAFLSLLILATLLWWFRTIRLLDRLAAVTKERDDWKNDHSSHSVKLDEANEDVRRLEHKLAECRDRAGDLQSELDHARDDAERLGDEKRRLKCELDESETRRHELTRELDRYKDECGDLGQDQTQLKAQIEEMSERYKRLKRRYEELEQRASASHHEADQTRQSLAECRTQAGRLEERLDACHQSKGDRDRRIHELEHLVSASREEAQRLSDKLRRCHERNEQHSQELLRASTAGAAAESRAQQLERALHECQRGSLISSAAASRAEQEAAFAATLGATREMAANGKRHDCCHNHAPAPAPVIVAHNTPSHSAASPLSGSAPVGGGVPGATAAGGPAGTSGPGGVAAGAPSAPTSAAGPAAGGASGAASPGPASSGSAGPSSGPTAGPAASGSPGGPASSAGPAASPGPAGGSSASGSPAGPASAAGPAAGPGGAAAASGAATGTAGAPGGSSPSIPGAPGGGLDLLDLAGGFLGL